LYINSAPLKSRKYLALAAPFSRTRHLKSLLNIMIRYKPPSRYEATAASELARRRVGAVLACLKVLCPNAERRTRQQLASKILTLVHGIDRPVPQKMITPPRSGVPDVGAKQPVRLQSDRQMPGVGVHQTMM